MKYLFVLLLGLVVGAILGVAALYFNPLTARGGEVPDAGSWVLDYGSPISTGLTFTHGGQTRLPVHPSGTPELWENTINKTTLSVFRVTGPDGQAAVASRVSLPSERTDMLIRGVVVTDHWLITVPGEGSLFIDSDMNVWPFVKRDLLPVWYLGRTWRGPHNYLPTLGPGLDRSGIVQGATGRFAEREGYAREEYRMSVFNTQRGPEQFEATLHIDLPERIASAAGETPQ